MEGKILIGGFFESPAHQELFKRKNIRRPIRKAFGKCGRDKEKWKTAPKRYGNKREHGKENILMNTWYQADNDIVMRAGDCF